MSHPLGILDWGIGGLDLYRKLRARGSTCDVIYWSDAGAPPYGTLPPEALGGRLAAVLSRLASRGCSQVIVACNAASTALGDPRVAAIAQRRGCEVLGVIEPTVRTILAQGLPRVALIAGRRTVESRAYARPLEAGGCEVQARVAQPLSALIERGITEGPALEACLDPILAPLVDAEHLVLACTHYVAAAPAIRRHLPRLRALLDPAAETLRAVEHRTGTHAGRGTARFLTTGSPAAMQTAARLAFGVTLPEVHRDLVNRRRHARRRDLNPSQRHIHK